MTAETISIPVRTVPDPLAGERSFGQSEGSGIAIPWNLMEERDAKDDLRWYLIHKYRTILIDRLTAEDLGELRVCLKRWSGTKNGQDSEFPHRFVMKLREYLPEEILRYEIAGIESLFMLMRAQDLPDRHRAASGAVTRS
ncbi:MULTISPECIES: hypothetical protein [unclassified Methanoregula]|uniref:hypothetical protein n=1 Tax=unclassified Methanoregula TaxID=2649730 RepID=UPI0009C77F4E|nr:MULTISPECIES: hypothetical protein [unclassified Methanoregula]OPX61768.1 MAG: hypothetical protein A4E33_02870 [Methanoregula sp. PtaB.Bin085]OPY33923.1 MAG: hypothetical protein A4E34_01508 [Methanoregula sp. PtaU1.Bin006]